MTKKTKRGADWTPPTKTIVLVSCGKTKATAAAPARELYTSALFQKSRAHAEALVAAGEADGWFILSAKHGVLHPDTVVEPYDERVPGAQVAMGKWGADVVEQLRALFPGEGVELVVLAGVMYAAPIAQRIEDLLIHRQGWACLEPLRGLEVGERLHWLNEQAAKRELAVLAVAEACPSCGAAAGEPCRSGTKKVRGPHNPRREAADHKRIVARQAAAATARTVYIGTKHDKELLPCPVCIGEAQGIVLCFRPMGKIGRDRWTSLEAGYYHAARVPEAVAAAAELELAALREKILADQAEKGHTEALEENARRAPASCPKCGNALLRLTAPHQEEPTMKASIRWDSIKKGSRRPEEIPVSAHVGGSRHESQGFVSVGIDRNDGEGRMHLAMTEAEARVFLQELEDHLTWHAWHAIVEANARRYELDGEDLKLETLGHWPLDVGSETIRRAIALDVGQEIELGGGAAATFTLRRIA
jgi:hypothetical protein